MTKYSAIVFLLVTYSCAQIQGWSQNDNGKLGPVYSVRVNSQGMIFASVLNAGLYRSLDTGKTWSQVAPSTNGVWSFAFDSHDNIFAALWKEGIFYSSDNGDSWDTVASNMKYSDIRNIDSSNVLFIESAGVAYCSDDQGVHWDTLSVAGGVVASSGSTLYAAKGLDISSSDDNGKTWSSIHEGTTPAYSMTTGSGKVLVGLYCSDSLRTNSILLYDKYLDTWNQTGPQSTVNAIIQTSPSVFYAATHDSGCYVSTDSGTTWSQMNKGLTTAKTYSLAQFNDTMIVAGTLDGVFFGSPSGNIAFALELTSLSATRTITGIQLQWQTASETDNYGFEIQRSEVGKQSPEGIGTNASRDDWERVGFVEGAGTSNVPHSYQFTDNTINLHFSGIVSYRLQQIDRNGAVHLLREITVFVIGTPLKFSLSQNYPNPFNPSTEIGYELSEEGPVTLRIYDVAGRAVSTLVDETKKAGDYSVQFDASALASGTYFAALRCGNRFEVRKMVLLK